MGKSRRIVNLFFFVFILLLGAVLMTACSDERNNTSALLQAIENEDAARVKAILDSDVDPNEPDPKPHWIWTMLEVTPRRPLSVACDTGNLEIVELLIEYGATAEHNEDTGWSPLRETLFYYHPDDPEIVEILLQNGADPDSIEDGLYVFTAAKMIPREYDKNKTNGTVFKDGYDEKTARGIVAIVDRLMSGKPIDITNEYGQTLLMTAAQTENICLIEYLLSADCDAAITDLSGKTALDYAYDTGNEQVIALLLRVQ